MGGRLSRKELEKIIRLSNAGKSLNEISRITGKNKTTIYHHFLKIRGKTFSPIKVLSEDRELIGEFIGLFAGDGSVYITKEYQYRVYLHFNVTEREFAEDLISNVLIKLFGKRPMISNQENRLNLCYYSKNIYEFVHEYLTWDKDIRKTYSVKLKDKDWVRKFLIGFIRGSIDSDGHYSKSRATFASVSPGLIRNISDALSALKIKHNVRCYKDKRCNRKDIYHINVQRSEHSKFRKLINPRNKMKFWD